MLKPKNITRIIFFTVFAAAFFMVPYLIKATEGNPEKRVRQQFYRHIQAALPMEKDRLAVCNCAMTKLKGSDVELPPNKQKALFETVGNRCYGELHGLTFSWNASLREMLRRQIFKHSRFSGLNNRQKIEYLDCFISTMKNRYPLGMSNHIPESALQTAGNYCYKNASANNH